MGPPARESVKSHFLEYSVLIPYVCSLQSHRLWSHAVDVTPPQAATKIMAGIAEWWNGRRNGRRNGGLAERMAEWQKFDVKKQYIHTIFYIPWWSRSPGLAALILQFRQNPPGCTSVMGWLMAALEDFVSFCKLAEK